MSDHRYPKIICKELCNKNLMWYKHLNSLVQFLNIENILNPFSIQTFIANVNQLYNLISIKIKQDVMDKVVLANYHLIYKQIKFDNCISPYLLSDCSLKQKQIICKARTEMLALNFRPWIPNHCDKCTLCIFNVDETVLHFMGDCPIISEFRRKYFGNVSILHDECLEILKGKCGWKNLAYFLTDAMKYRRQLIDEFNF